jgi:hypothetical protein
MPCQSNYLPMSSSTLPLYVCHLNIGHICIPSWSHQRLPILGIWVLALIRQNSLRDGLLAYTTSTKYTQLWDNDQGLKPPGAGDIFGSVLDVSIVALSLPMFRYRNELKARFMTIIVPNVIVSIGSLFAYPVFCYHIGISAPRGLAFASRSLTLALATPATNNLGGDPFTIAPLCIFSGIAGVIVGPIGLDLLKIPKGAPFSFLVFFPWNY